MRVFTCAWSTGKRQDLDDWIERKLRPMSLEQKVGRRLVPWVRLRDAEPWAAQVERLQRGSVFLRTGGPAASRKFLETAQARASTADRSG